MTTKKVQCVREGCTNETYPQGISRLGNDFQYGGPCGWETPLCEEHDTAISVESALKIYSQDYTDEWAKTINLREDEKDPEAITELSKLAELMAENPDMTMGGVGLTGADPLIHSVRNGLIRKGNELIKRGKL
jgi:hypothetical protein